MSVNDKYVYNIEIDTMQDAKEMVAIATKLNGKIVLKSGAKFSVNAKSLLGVLLYEICGRVAYYDVEFILNGVNEGDRVMILYVYKIIFGINRREKAHVIVMAAFFTYPLKVVLKHR